MKYKKYNFIKILEEYNKEYKRNHKLDLRILSATITHCAEDGTFNVMYIYSDDDTHQKYGLGDFLYYKVAPSLDIGLFKAIILRKEEQDLGIKIEIWPPSKIRYAYLYTNYFSNDVGHLGKSCMRGKDNQRALNFYVKNNVKIVVAVDGNNKIHARALLWDNVKTTRTKTPFTYLDRVYTRLEHLTSPFYKLAEENEWKRYGSTSAGEAKGNYYKDDIDITDICHLPYADTFGHLYYKDNLITSGSVPNIVKYKDCHVNLTIVAEEGYFPALDPNRVREALTNRYISKKDAVFVKRYDAYVLKKNLANVKGAYYSIHDNKVVKSQLDGFILKVNSTTEVFTNELIGKAEAVHSIKYNGYMHKSNIIDIKGEMYHKKDTDITCFDNKWYHISQCFINYDREKRNKTLLKKKFHFWIEDEVFVPYPDDFVVRKDGLIPKEYVIIAYDITYSPVLDNIEYQEVYCKDKKGLIRLNTGELIVGSASNKKYLKKFNNKYYIKQDFKLPSKHQLTLF